MFHSVKVKRIRIVHKILWWSKLLSINDTQFQRKQKKINGNRKQNGLIIQLNGYDSSVYLYLHSFLVTTCIYIYIYIHTQYTSIMHATCHLRTNPTVTGESEDVRQEGIVGSVVSYYRQSQKSGSFNKSKHA